LNVLDPLQPLPAIPIKDEPIDTDDDYQMKSIDESDDMVDPTMFLERSEHEGDVPLTVSHHEIPVIGWKILLERFYFIKRIYYFTNLYDIQANNIKSFQAFYKFFKNKFANS